MSNGLLDCVHLPLMVSCTHTTGDQCQSIHHSNVIHHSSPPPRPMTTTHYTGGRFGGGPRSDQNEVCGTPKDSLDSSPISRPFPFHFPSKKTKKEGVWEQLKNYLANHLGESGISLRALSLHVRTLDVKSSRDSLQVLCSTSRAKIIFTHYHRGLGKCVCSPRYLPTCLLAW